MRLWTRLYSITETLFLILTFIKYIFASLNIDNTFFFFKYLYHLLFQYKGIFYVFFSFFTGQINMKMGFLLIPTKLFQLQPVVYRVDFMAI